MRHVFFTTTGSFPQSAVCCDSISLSCAVCTIAALLCTNGHPRTCSLLYRMQPLPATITTEYVHVLSGVKHAHDQGTHLVRTRNVQKTIIPVGGGV